MLGTILILQNKSNLESALGALGLPKVKADAIANSIGNAGGGDLARGQGGRHAEQFLHAVQHSYALSSQTIFYAMAGVMAVCFVVALIALPGGKMEVIEDKPAAGPPGSCSRCRPVVRLGEGLIGTAPSIQRLGLSRRCSSGITALTLSCERKISGA